MQPVILAEEEQSLGELMKEALFPDDVSFFGIGVNPSFLTAVGLTLIVLVFGLIFRFLIFPHFKKDVPGKFQCLMEKACEGVTGIMKGSSPHSYDLIGTVAFGACIYIGLGTLCELIGVRAILVDLNACVALAVTAYVIMLAGGFWGNRIKGFLGVLKDFSLLLSMSFRLFGSMISGLLMTELVYEFIFLSIGVPIVVGVIFTVFHAFIQSYVYILLIAMFFGEAVEPRFLDGTTVKSKKIKKHKAAKQGA
ncbi:MAG: F0F1 ATP synthase subunit A [Christensenellaceae bacterium]